MAPPQKQMPYRDNRVMVEALECVARSRGRSTAAELRLAVFVWVMRATVVELEREDGGAEHAADLAEIREGLKEMEARVLAIPPQPAGSIFEEDVYTRMKLEMIAGR